MKLRAFFLSLRPWSFPVTVSAVAVGGALAYRYSGRFDWSGFVLSLMGGLLVHAFGNMVNTYGDYLHGVDRADNAADDRAIVGGSVTPREARGIAIACLLGAIGALIALSGRILRMSVDPSAPLSPFQCFLLLVGVGVGLAYAYTGTPFLLKYRRLGDVAIFIAFGPLLVEGAYFVQTGELSRPALWFSVPVGLLTEAILHANNARDITIDLAAGVRTLANTIGFDASYVMFQALYTAIFAALPVFAWQYHSLWYLLPVLSLPLLPKLLAGFRAHDPTRTDEKKTDEKKGKKVATTTEAAVHICDLCGQFSFLYGMLLSVAITLA